MTRTTRTLATAALALVAFAAALPAQAQSFIQTRDWDVCVDVKTPVKGRAFVRLLAMRQGTRLAGQPAATRAE